MRFSAQQYRRRWHGRLHEGMTQPGQTDSIAGESAGRAQCENGGPAGVPAAAYQRRR